MTTVRKSQALRTIPLLVTICLFSFPVYAKYGGGTGKPNDPYQIATAEDLILLGDSPEDYDKQYILTADIDLDPNLPGRKVFDRAVIAPDTNERYFQFQGTPFTGVFDGNDHIIRNAVIQQPENSYNSYIELFGYVGTNGQIRNVGLENVEITGWSYVGGLACISHNPVEKSSLFWYNVLKTRKLTRRQGAVS